MRSQIRYQGLDHLRGLLALTVMVYHFSFWLGYEDNLPFVVQRPLNLLGLYAVSTFYCLSGAALFIVYRSRAVDRKFIREFAIKRSFRICPLFWAATTASLTYAGFAALFDNPWRVFLSYSLLFSWLDPTAYFAIGAWSIGNEWAFYSLFPILLVAWKRSWSRLVVLIGAFVASSYYAFAVIDPAISVADQWASYIAPLNHVLLFVGGMVVGSLLVEGPVCGRRTPLSILFGASLVFIAISYTFDRQYCIHGNLRLILVGVCLSWCYCAGTFRMQSGRIGRFLDWVGTLSYSVYLLHPIVFKLTTMTLDKVLARAPDSLSKEYFLSIPTFVIAALGTVIASHYSYIILERPAMRYGRTLATKMQTLHPGHE